ncbi:SsrA-binding protein SmpB [bacterium]|nr:SsrA-binding protein SmpB [bacterium]
MSKKNAPASHVEIRNRKAGYEYELLDRYTAGLVLMGTEIKSLRTGKAQISEAYCVFHANELWVHELLIEPYAYGTHINHAARRERKLLLSRRELDKIEVKLKDVGMTLIPTRLYINEKGLAKLDIALAKGKKLHDKRDSIKDRDVQRELDRAKHR